MGATWTISVIDNDGNVYTGSSDSALNLNGVAIPINGLTKTVEIVKLTITSTMPIGVTPPAIIHNFGHAPIRELIVVLCER